MTAAPTTPRSATVALSEARPQLALGVSIEAGPGGGACVVRAGGAAGACDVTAAEASALTLLDGERDVRDLQLALAGGVPALRPAATLGLLQRLQRQGMLRGLGAAAAADLGAPPAGPSWPARLQGLLLLRVALPLSWPAALRGTRALGPWTGAPLLACALALLALLPDGADRRAFDPFAGDDVARRALLLYVAAALLASARGVARAMLLASAGAAPQLVLALTCGVPHLDVDDSARRRLSRDDRVALYLAGLAALAWPAALALVGARVVSGWPDGLPPLLASIALVAPYLLLVDLAPYGRGDGWNLAGAVTGVPDLRRRSAAFLLRRSIANLGRGERPSPAERTYLGLGSAWLAHGVLTGWLLSDHLLPGALDAVVALARSGDASPLRWAVAMTTASGLALVAVGLAVALGAIFAAAVVQLLRRRPTRGGGDAPTTLGDAPAEALVDAARSALASIPLFAVLDDADRDALAHELRFERWPRGAAIVRQGDPGDRFCLLLAGEATVLVEEESGLRHSVAKLRAGDFFGEMALLHDRPRAASVIAEGPVQVAALARQRFLALVGDSGDTRAAVLDQVRNAAAIRAIDGFAGLSTQALAALLGAVRTLALPAEGIALRQGTVGEALYLIRSGALRIERREDGQTYVLDRLGPGDVCGEFALVSGEARSASAIVEQDAVLIEIPADALDAAIVADPRLGVVLYEAMARRRLAHGGG